MRALLGTASHLFELFRFLDTAEGNETIPLFSPFKIELYVSASYNVFVRDVMDTLIFINLCLYLYIFLSIHIYICIYIYIFIYISIYPSIYLSIYLSIYIYIHAYTYIHLHTYTYYVSGPNPYIP